MTHRELGRLGSARGHGRKDNPIRRREAGNIGAPLPFSRLCHLPFGTTKSHVSGAGGWGGPGGTVSGGLGCVCVTLALCYKEYYAMSLGGRGKAVLKERFLYHQPFCSTNGHVQ